MSEEKKLKVKVEELERQLEELDPEQAAAVQGGRGIRSGSPRPEVPDIIVGTGPGGPAGHVK
jgi:hypothetical protein